MMDYIEILLNAIENKEFSPFRTARIDKAYNDYVSKYIFTTDNHEEKQLEQEELLNAAITEEQANAFRVGFKTAFSLFVQASSVL